MKRRLILLTLLATCGLTCLAAEQTYQVVNDANMKFHWPELDGLIGTADDVVSNAVSNPNTSGANTNGSLSYNAFNFGGPRSAWMPADMNAITFLQGSLTIDMAVAKSGGGALVRNWQVTGTEPFFSHGPYSSMILRVISGAYDTNTHAISLSVDMTATLVFGTANASNLVLTGEAYVVDAADFGRATGNTYVDTVLIPHAVTAGAGSLAYVRASGTLPASSGGTGGSFPSMPIAAVMVGFYQPLKLQVSPAAGGVTLQWNPASGTTYSIEATTSLSTPFQTIATNLAGPAFLDNFVNGQAMRFYRLRQP